MLAPTGLVRPGADLAGMLLAMLHLIKHWAYRCSLDAIIGLHSFLSGVPDAPPWRKIATVAVCGLTASFGCWTVDTQDARWSA